MPETKQRRRGASPNATQKSKRSISRPRRSETAKQGRYSRGWTFRTKPEPTGVRRVLGALTGSEARSKKGGAAAAGGLAVIAGGVAALRQRRRAREAPSPGPVTTTNTPTQSPANTGQTLAQDGP
jgi:hypothetical protein